MMANKSVGSDTVFDHVDSLSIQESRLRTRFSTVKVAALARVLGAAAIDRSMPADLCAAVRTMGPSYDYGRGRRWASQRLTCDEFPAGVFVKAYWPLVHYNVVRALSAKPLLKRAGLHVAEILATAIVRRGSTPLLVTCEAPCPGTPYRPRSAADARSLGQDLARWHAIDLSRYESAVFRSSLFLPPSTAIFRDLARAAGTYGDTLAPVADYLTRLRDRSFLGPMALCQSDPVHSNFLVEPEGRIWWIDLDRTMVMPARANFVDTLVRLAEVPTGREHIEAFLTAYFAGQPGELEAWRHYRIDWLRTRMAIDLLNAWWWASRRSIPFRQRPGKPLARTIAAFTLVDRGEGTADLMAAFDRRWHTINRELELDGSPVPQPSPDAQGDTGGQP